jgi:urea transport system substrate-binding protein
MRKLTRMVALGAVILAVGGGWVAVLGDSSDGPIKIGVPIPMSGAFAIFGEQMRQATELWLKEINDAGGLIGRPVEASYVDTQSEVQPTIDGVKDLIYNKNVDVLIGVVSSANRDAIVPTLYRTKTVLINPSSHEGMAPAKHAGQGARYLFLTGAIPEQWAKPYIEWIINNIGSKFYCIGMDYAWGRGSIANAKEFILELGATIVGEEYTPVGTTDFGAVLNRVLAAEPDVLYNVMAGADLIYIVKQFHEFGLKENGITFGPMYIDEGYFAALGPEALTGITGSGYSMSLDTEENLMFLQGMREMYGDDIVVGSMTVAQYNALTFFEAAVERARSVETADLIRGLEGVGVSSLQGEQWLRAEDHVLIIDKAAVYVIEADPSVPWYEWMKLVAQPPSPVPALQGNVFVEDLE